MNHIIDQAGVIIRVHFSLPEEILGGVGGVRWGSGVSAIALVSCRSGR